VTVRFVFHALVSKVNGARAASVVLPAPQNWAALHDAGANCRDLDGNIIGNLDVEYSIELAKDLGGFAICWGEVSDEGWPMVMAGYSEDRPPIYGFSMEQFSQVCQARLNDLLAIVSQFRPDAAASFTGVAETAATEVRDYLLPLTYSDPFVQSLRVWVVARLGGSQTQQYPSVLFDSEASGENLGTNSTNLAGLKTLWTEWNAQDETSDLRLVLRLWEYAQMGILVDALAA